MTYYQATIKALYRRIYTKPYLIEQVIQARHFIDNNFAQKLYLDDIAAKAYLSKFHFIRLFKSFYGITPGQYVITVRIRAAKKLLDKGESSTGNTRGNRL